MSKQFYFKQFSLNAKTVPSQTTQFSFILPIDRTLSGAPTQGQSGPGSDGNEGVLYIPQSSSIPETLPSDCLVSYIQDTHCEDRKLTLLQKSSWCILQPQPTEQITQKKYSY